jgi:acyl-homoserine lactone acylase PvdQ
MDKYTNYNGGPSMSIVVATKTDIGYVGLNNNVKRNNPVQGTRIQDGSLSKNDS